MAVMPAYHQKHGQAVEVDLLVDGREPPDAQELVHQAEPAELSNRHAGHPRNIRKVGLADKLVKPKALFPGVEAKHDLQGDARWGCPRSSTQ